jgi:cadmium resistance protein CadD (predicted permease)
MEQNVGLMDQKVRIGLGAVLGLVSLVVLAQSKTLISQMIPVPTLVSPLLGVLSLILLATGYFRKCALYNALGMSTEEE